MWRANLPFSPSLSACCPLFGASACVFHGFFDTVQYNVDSIAWAWRAARYRACLTATRTRRALTTARQRVMSRPHRSGIACRWVYPSSVIMARRLTNYLSTADSRLAHTSRERRGEGVHLCTTRLRCVCRLFHGSVVGWPGLIAFRNKQRLATEACATLSSHCCLSGAGAL